MTTQRSVGEAKKGDAPRTPDGLGMRIEGPHLPFCGINGPGRLADVSAAPFTIDADDGPRTFMFERMVGSEEYELRRIEATVNQPFRLEIRLPHKEEGLLRFALLDSPPGMEIDRYTGIIRWEPGADQVGNHRVAVAHRFHQLTPYVEEFILPVKVAGSEPG